MFLKYVCVRTSEMERDIMTGRLKITEIYIDLPLWWWNFETRQETGLQGPPAYLYPILYRSLHLPLFICRRGFHQNILLLEDRAAAAKTASRP